MIGNPFPLKANAGKSFQGSIVLGKGFILSPEEAEALIAKEPRNKNVLFPYLNGDDLNNDPEQKPSRWVINFFDWSEERARTYSDCFEIVERLVKPERMQQNDKGGKEKWWQFLRPRKELYETISQLDQVMVLPRVSKYFLVSFSFKNIVFSDATVVLALDSFVHYAVLSSSIHEVWAWKNSSTMKGDALRYSASKAFETFPFPNQQPSRLEELGKVLYTLRKDLMIECQIGLTELQNLFHSNKIKQSDKYYEKIILMRNLLCELDLLVLKAYDWQDIDLTHNFHEIEFLPEKDRVRYTIGSSARKEVLNRLFKLNYNIHNRELRRENETKKKNNSGPKLKIADLFG